MAWVPTSTRASCRQSVRPWLFFQQASKLTFTVLRATLWTAPARSHLHVSRLAPFASAQHRAERLPRFPSYLEAPAPPSTHRPHDFQSGSPESRLQGGHASSPPEERGRYTTGAPTAITSDHGPPSQTSAPAHTAGEARPGMAPR